MEFIDLLGARADERLFMRGETMYMNSKDAQRMTKSLRDVRSGRMNYVNRSSSEESEMEDL
jgi:hypothetical protein